MYRISICGITLYKFKSISNNRRFLFKTPNVIKVRISPRINHNVIENNNVIINHILTSLVCAHNNFFISISS
jgi:hypothetical protein